MSPQDVLRQAADLIERTGWCQGVYARDARGVITDFISDAAVEFCALGAIFHCEPEGYAADVSAPEQLLVNRIGTRTVGEWNDAPGRTKDEVIATLRKAAEGA